MSKKAYLFLSLSALAGIGLALLTASRASADKTETGNGGPSGAHYNLNIIGCKYSKDVDGTGSNGQRIFVLLSGKTKILLKEGKDFKVLDYNGTDGEATFQLPNPDPDNDGITAYSVYVRELGTPGGSAKLVSCFKDVDGDFGTVGATYCSVGESVELKRTSGQSKFRNVSKELLSICADTDGDMKCDTRVFLFDDAGDEYWWEYTNSGLRLAQLRFYEIPTNVGLNP